MCVFDLLYIQSLGPFKYYILSHPQGGGVCPMLILAYGGRRGVKQLLTAYRGMGSQINVGAAHPLRDVKR